MKNLFLKYIAIFLTIGFTGCVKDVDFSQVDDFQFQPEMQLGLVSFELTDDNITEKMYGKDALRDTISLDAFDEEYFRDNLHTASFSVQVNNSLSYNIVYEMKFVDASNNEVYTINSKIPGKITSEPVRKRLDFFLEDESAVVAFRKTKFLVLEIVPQNRQTGILQEGSFVCNASTRLKFNIE